MHLEGSRVLMDGGALIVERPGRVLRLDPWPRPGAYAGIDRHRAATPTPLVLGLADLEALSVGRDPRAKAAAEAFVDRIPARVRAAVEPYSEDLVGMLQLAASGGRFALELMESNRGLALAIAHRAALQPACGLTSETLGSMKRHQALEALGIPGGKPSVALLGKLNKQALTLRTLRVLIQLLDTLGRERLRELAQLEQLSTEVLAIYQHPFAREHVGPGLMELASRMRCYRSSIAERIEEVKLDFELFGLGEPTPVFQTFEAIEAAQAQVLKNRPLVRLTDIRSKVPMPPPPVPGNGNIVPIDSATELWAESCHQENCAVRYYHAIRGRRWYLYRMLLPERCTISILRVDGEWWLSEVKATFNQRPVKPGTWRVLRRWATENGVRLLE